MFIEILFLCSAVATIACAIGVLVSKNIMHSCVFLMGTLLAIAGLYVTMGADFVAAAQIMVYMGGVVILMLFAIMLTGGKDYMSKAQKLLGLPATMGTKFTYGLGILTGLVFILTNVKILAHVFANVGDKANSTEFTSTVSQLGHLLVKDHVLAFELSSVLLLGALIGAAIIARPRKNQ